MDKFVDGVYPTFFTIGRNRIDYLPTNRDKKRIYAIECRLTILDDIKLTYTLFTEDDVKEVDCNVRLPHQFCSARDLEEALMHMYDVLRITTVEICGRIGVKLLNCEKFAGKVVSTLLPPHLYEEVQCDLSF